jgi:ectoine hydroxylase-related dioxygenase (phytanoyl-CoA dioxygenase family)
MSQTVMNATSASAAWEERGADAAQIAAWVETMHRDGFLVIENFLSAQRVAALTSEIERAFAEHKDQTGGIIELRCRMFEASQENVRLFDLEPMATFAETLIATECHVVHNNAFTSPPGGGITFWHQDDPPHMIVTSGEPPKNIQLPVLLFTANYYLTDVTTLADGPTQFVPGSHLFGASPPADVTASKYKDTIRTCYGRAGTVIIFNNQVWHRGAPVTGNRTRLVTQVSYARRIIGHRYFPFMNYQMPEHVYRDANPRLRRLLGFLPTGPYG